MWRKSLFRLGASDLYEGYTADEHWNGFAVPWFEKAIAEQILDDLKAAGSTWTFNAADDRYEIHQGGAPEGWVEPYGAIILEHEGKDIKAYSIGGYAWVWTEDAWTPGSIRETARYKAWVDKQYGKGADRRWVVGEPALSIQTEDGTVIATMATPLGSYAFAKANAERIVAAMQLLDGIPTEEIVKAAKDKSTRWETLIQYEEDQL
jgi:hypothetical protein